MNSCQTKIGLINVAKSFDEVDILENINIHVNKGELVSILGPSGSGKSTIFNLITNLTDVDSGEIKISGKVSYMYQKDMMVPWKKVIDNIGLPLIFNGKSKGEARSEVEKHIKAFGLDDFKYKYPNQLSGGMKQRANFLKTYLTSDDIMLLDEPFGALDSITRRKLQLWLLDLIKDMKSTILFITHDIDEAIFLSDRIYIISDKPAKIKGEIKVNLNMDRDENVVLTDEFINIKREINKIMNF